MKNSQFQSLEDYLAQVAHELRALPATARAEEVREIEAHLRALVLAGQQPEDVGEAEATALALRQFGAPRAIGKKLRRAWERKQPEAWWRVVLAPVGAFTFQIFALFLIAAVDEKLSLSTQLQGLVPQSDLGIVNASLLVVYVWFSCLASGLVSGMISPKRSRWGIATYFLLVLTGISSATLGRGISAYDGASGASISVVWSLIGLHILLTLLYLCGSQIGAVSAENATQKLPTPNNKEPQTIRLRLLPHLLRQLAQIVLHHRAQPFGIERFR